MLEGCFSEIEVALFLKMFLALHPVTPYHLYVRLQCTLDKLSVDVTVKIFTFKNLLPICFFHRTENLQLITAIFSFANT